MTDEHERQRSRAEIDARARAARRALERDAVTFGGVPHRQVPFQLAVSLLWRRVAELRAESRARGVVLNDPVPVPAPDPAAARRRG